VGAVAGVEVAGDALVLEDYGPWDDGGVDGEEGATGGEGERLHISHDTIEVMTRGDCSVMAKVDGD
jgi:hypothetical protein